MTEEFHAQFVLGCEPVIDHKIFLVRLLLAIL